MTTPEIASELQTALALIKGYIWVFASHGYEYSGSQSQSSKVAGDSIVFTFVNDKAGMRITITYFPPYKQQQRDFVILVHDGKGENFSLGDYLQTHKRDDVQLLLKAENRNPDFRVYWEDFFRKLDRLFNADLNDIVEGRRWENIPIDWGDYK
jgi:hypothetical protein